MTDAPTHIGTAGWSVPSRYADRFPTEGSHLERYARRLNAVEINTSFYRPHRRATYERWAASVPAAFRFAVKLPRTMTHERRLKDCDTLLDRFAGEVAGLGPKLGVLLVQLPPSLAFDAKVVKGFFAELRRRTAAPVACEPRHAGWFGPQAEGLLQRLRVARVAADPVRAPGAGEPGGWQGLVYYRLHGSPRIYISDYDEAVLAGMRRRLQAHRAAGVPAWCIFDNTAAFAALGNALTVAGR
ncbi:DUF72 domain-containing protein [Inquilinus sp.]|jgi:uncharacterized protein YecE (DUF72 family)|uniref:DUF72 domain-containing protein n=1 Tax=Inquilinus sp. TaxID=1932117 RepID=UPI0037831116